MMGRDRREAVFLFVLFVRECLLSARRWRKRWGCLRPDSDL